jgi:outer membrane protein
LNRCIAALVGVGFLICTSAASGSDYVIGVIDPTRIVEQSPQYEAARAQLQKEVSEREQKLAEQQKQIVELQKKLDSDAAALMSQDELQRLQTDIRNRDRKVKYAQAEFREDFALRQNELRTKLAKQVEEVVAELAREENIDLILSESLVYFSKRIDISEKVIERLRKKFEAK